MFLNFLLKQKIEDDEDISIKKIDFTNTESFNTTLLQVDLTEYNKSTKGEFSIFTLKNQFVVCFFIFLWL